MNKPLPVEFVPPKKLADYPLGPCCPSTHIVGINAGMRTFRPVIDHDKCVHCLRCFLVCPEGTIDKSEDQLQIDLNYCKGCGVCAHECKVGAITLVKETEA